MKFSIRYIFLKISFCFLLISICTSNIYFCADNKDYIKVNVPSAVVMDINTGRFLYDKNGDEVRPMASLTKIITSLILVENCNLDEQIQVPKEATILGGSTVGLKKGDTLTARSLLYGMLLPSGNDCAYTAAIHIGGTIENFANIMNERIKQMGITDTSFANPHGLDNDNHHTSAKSMAIITKYALENKYINEAVNTASITINFGSFSKNLNNTNALLRTYDKADGVKTGFTNGANRCLVASATYLENRYIAVVLGAETTNIRFSTAKNILEDCFNRYKSTDISDYLNFYFNIPVIKGNVKSYEKKISDNMTIPLADGEYDKIFVKQNIIQEIKAPMCIGTKLGNIEVFIEDELIYSKDVYLEENIYKKNILDYISESFKIMFQTTQIL